MDNDQLDEIRRGIQESLSQAKKEELRDKHGMRFEFTDSQLSPEMENEWLDNVLDFERQFESGKTITVRERIGNPPITPLKNISIYALDQAVTYLLELMAAHGISVDFLGEIDDIEAYRYLTEELLNYEMDDIRVEGFMTCFTHTSLEYDVQMWVHNFVLDFFTQEREYFLPGLEKQPLFDIQGEPITAADFILKIEMVWERLAPTNRITVEPILTQATEAEATVTATVIWQDESSEAERQVESFFRLQPSPYMGWDVVQTSLLDDLLK